MLTIKEMLQLTLRNITNAFGDPGNNCDGICSIPAYLEDKMLISSAERLELFNYLDAILPTRSYYNDYCWEPGELSPRISWLNERISRVR